MNYHSLYRVKNSSNLYEKDNSPVSLNSKANGTNLWSYFEHRMSGNKCKITSDRTVNSILILYLDKPHSGLTSY